ncbi:MAG: serine O-acetyltransferase [Candidatus ainarchaeum sp.]|nr:serine O-acetyltransferase [Candidatus ainarchaeum sp.]
MSGELKAAYENDPAAKSYFEIILCYPGVHALLIHRISHKLYEWNFPAVVPRLISHVGRFLTGIEIHPGAKIGNEVFIDHGMGVVIGETAEVGDKVVIFQGAVLGGTGRKKGSKRHPTVGSFVTVGAGSILLGPITVGDNVKIGAGAVVLKDIPPDSTAVGVPARIVRHKGQKVADLEHGRIDDPMQAKLHEIDARIRAVEKKSGIVRGPEEEAGKDAE